MNVLQLLNLIILITVFVLVFSLWCLCVFIWLGKYLVRIRQIQQRLGLAESKETEESKILRLWRDTQHGEDFIVSSEKLTFQDRLRRIANDAGWHTPVQVVALGVFGVAVFAFVTALITGWGSIVGLGLSALVVILFWAYTKRRIDKRAALFEKQLVDALGIAARSLRAGHPLVGSFQLIYEEVNEPLSNIFYRICQEQALGLDLRESIRKISKITSNSELKLFSTAVAIQLQSGGDLADLMDSLSSVIRERMRLNRRVRVLIAQTQFSARILIGLPIFLFFVLNFISPDYMKTFYSGKGLYLLGIMILSVIFGYLVMKRLTIIKY